ncbi:cullin-3A-like protein [Medicago truncatula]|uniref:Cullin-3A-like protein n=1 Tax=Medicago truncatula TaxID=3880 RepID=A0A072VGU5_MEDTR|nr:cullin-3A-like protein [Medicago truncatula]
MSNKKKKKNNMKKKKDVPIEAFKDMSAEYGDKAWNILEHAIRRIYNHNARNILSFEELYRNACNMIFHGFGEKLYSGLVAIMTSQLKEMATSVAATRTSSFLKELNRKWNDHSKALRKIRDILMYMDTTYIPKTNKTPVYELGLSLWRENVIYSNQIRTRLSNMLLVLVCKDYAGEVVDRKLIRYITNMLMDLGPSVYMQEFENPLLQVSAEFYRAESQKLIERYDCGDYLKKAEMRLNEVIDKVSHFLDPSTQKKITIVVEKEMIENHMLRLIHMENSGLVNMIGDDKYKDLIRMYNLFRRVTGGLSQIREVMTSYIRDYGKQLVTGPERLKNPVEFVQRLLDEKDKFSRIINLAFSNGLNLWSENVIYSNQIRTRLSNTLWELVCKYYAGEVVNIKVIRNITNMLMDLGPSVYVQEFENPFLQLPAEFYRAESQKFIECCDCGDYLKKAEMRLNEVIDRVSHFWDPSTQKKITIVVEKEMIENHMIRLILMENSGLVNMIGDDKYEDLSRMYNLFRRVTGGLSQIREVITSYIRDYSKQLVTDPERLKNPVEFVQRLLDEKDKFSRIINLAFSNDKLFQKDLYSSFEFIINLNPRSPEYISLFLNDKLQNGLKGISEDVVEITLNKVMFLFRYLQEKDVFEKYYKKHLAKRLLSGKTVSDDAERSLIAKLKTECGYEFTAKLEGMLTDMKTSLHPMKSFYASHPELGDADGATLTVQVLTTGSWPTQSSVTCNIPTEMVVLCEKFLLYYLSNHTDRKLSWQTNMGTADLKATFENGQKHELNVSTYQMCVLMLFNNADRLSYKEIEQATEIPASDLKMCLQSLALVKGKYVLWKEPMNNYVSEIDAFFVNDKFSSKLYKVKIGSVVAETEPEPEKLKTQ